MPCYDSRSTDPEYVCEDVIRRLNRATRAACELVRAIKDQFGEGGLKEFDLSPSTLAWIRQHEKVDRKRKAR